MKSFLMMQFEIRSYQILIFDSIHLFSSFLFNLENSLLAIENMASTPENIEILDEIDVASIKSEASEHRDEVKVKQADLDGKWMIQQLRRISVISYDSYGLDFHHLYKPLNMLVCLWNVKDCEQWN